MHRGGDFESAGSQGGLADSPRYVGDVAAALVRRLDELVRSGLPAGIPSGFRDLDHMTGGFGRSDFVVIAGRPSMGKTALMVNVAERVTTEGHGHHDPQAVLFASLETHAEALVARMMASIAGLGRAELLNATPRTGVLDSALEELKRRPLMIDDRATTVDAIRKSALRCAETNGVGMLFVDALQTLRTQPRHSDREAELEEIAWSLKELAWELQCPVIASSYLGRGPEQRCDRRPYLSDLRDSSAIEEVADLVLLLYRDDVYVEDSSDRDTIEVAMVKNRNGLQPRTASPMADVSGASRQGGGSWVTRSRSGCWPPTGRSATIFRALDLARRKST